MFHVPSMRANPSDAATVGPDTIDAGTSGNGNPSGQRTVARSAPDRRDRLAPDLTTSAPGGNLVPDSFRMGNCQFDSSGVAFEDGFMRDNRRTSRRNRVAIAIMVLLAAALPSVARFEVFHGTVWLFWLASLALIVAALVVCVRDLRHSYIQQRK